ncbi:MAG: hypothetical protein MZW92_52070 [Comamonadaceae bacterium]|nr:hypothetical protein [Comamonadaceae bacterium]
MAGYGVAEMSGAGAAGPGPAARRGGALRLPVARLSVPGGTGRPGRRQYQHRAGARDAQRGRRCRTGSIPSTISCAASACRRTRRNERRAGAGHRLRLHRQPPTATC